MQSAFTCTAADAAAACTWTTFQMSSWGVRSPSIHQWFAEATLRLPTGGTGRVVLNDERHEQLLSLDVFSGGIHVYGIDRLVSPSAGDSGARTLPRAAPRPVMRCHGRRGRKVTAVPFRPRQAYRGSARRSRSRSWKAHMAARFLLRRSQNAREQAQRTLDVSTEQIASLVRLATSLADRTEAMPSCGIDGDRARRERLRVLRRAAEAGQQTLDARGRLRAEEEDGRAARG